MGDDFYFQLAASAVAVGVLVALAAWAKIARPAGPLNDVKARELFEHEFPGRRIDQVWVSTDGSAALARSGGLALVACPVGDGYAARQIPWGQAISSSFRNGRICVNLDDVSAPTAIIALPSWPPKDLAA